MLPIKNKPLIDILIRKLLDLNFDKIIINTYYRSEVIKEYLESQVYYSKILLVPEPHLLGTAGTLKENLDELANDDFLVMHGDNYFSDDLQEFMRFHRLDSTKSLMTMAIFESPTPELCGVVEIDKNALITNFYEKTVNPPTNLANAAIYMFKKDCRTVITNLNKDETDISLHLLPKLLGKSRAFKLKGYFVDIGTPDSYNSVKTLM
jgi:mannose-1-phosphate guanylyltransferase